MGLPCFFKVLIGDLKTTLRIPRRFAVKFGHILPDDAVLESKSGESWSVKIEQIGEHYCFTHGWPQFVKDHQLQMCDFLVFWPMLEGKATFRVSMYEQSGCEKELNLGTTSNFIDLENICSPCTTSPNSTQGAERNSSKSRVKNKQSNNSAKISDDSVKERNPRFVKFLRSHHRYRMAIPATFARENGIAGKKNLMLINSEGQKWPVELELRASGNGIILEMCRGLRDFWKKNRLTAGRRCVLEFISGADCFRVQMLKRGELANCPFLFLHPQSPGCICICKSGD